LLEFYLRFFGVELNMDDIASRVRKGLEFAVKLHFVAAPRIPIRADHVVAMSGVGILEIELSFTYFVLMAHPHSDP